MTCVWCGEEVPAGRYCIRCGAPQPAGADEGPAARPSARREFAAAPHERLSSPRLISTIYPHLPRARLAPFRLSLLAGAVVVAGLAALRLFPIALVAAATLVPLVTVLYLYDVDVYEGEPVRVLALTMAWGAVAGTALALAARAISPDGAGLLLASAGSRVVGRGVVVPLAGLALALAGPLVLLRYRKFNDVLDGVTFGAASAVALAGAEAIAQGVQLLRAGLRPVGDAVPWIFRLLTLGVLVPVLAAAAIGAAAAALWLRYRAPVRDRAALGPLGRPWAAVGFAAALLVAGGLAQSELSPRTALVALVALDLIALVALRRAIHVGLLEESREIDVGPTITCANCGRETAQHSFCANCGISLRALPKPPRPPRPAP